ncbi:MAG: MBL fold metallo-hydrolase [Endomicrobia bacterium]|nr:MBL fold metallo-hydrolase [Endomicrobiia bacterium]
MRKLFLCFAVLCFVAANVCAKDVTGQVRTYHVGDFEFIAIKDIETNMGKAILLQPNAEVVAKVMANNQNPSSINAFLVKGNNHKILIDTGIGSGGNAMNNLRTAGVEPEDITIVLLTHMHGDHIGGLITPEGEKVFPNAVIRMHAKELEYWVGDNAKDPGTSALARNVRSVYGDKIQTFNWGDEIIPEIKALRASGHTPGHTIFEINSDNQKMLVIGDLIHVLKVQIADPNMAVTFDLNPREAIETRKKVFKDVSKNKTRVAGMHIPFPGVGTITSAAGGAYEFSPSVSVN